MLSSFQFHHIVSVAAMNSRKIYYLYNKDIGLIELVEHNL
jgi:hypothetical protein